MRYESPTNPKGGEGTLFPRNANWLQLTKVTGAKVGGERALWDLLPTTYTYFRNKQNAYATQDFTSVTN